MSRASAMRAVLAFLALWLTTSGALAEKAIFFVPPGHRDLAASVGPAALEALEHGLRDAGWETLSPSQAGDGLDELGVARCTGGACVPEMLTALEAPAKRLNKAGMALGQKNDKQLEILGKVMEIAARWEVVGDAFKEEFGGGGLGMMM